MSSAPATLRLGPQAIALGITTSTHRGGVALVRGDRILAAIDYEGVESHTENLFPSIDRALEQASLTRRDLSVVACDVGPGSFTGVRASTAAATAIAIGLGLPTVGVSSLEAMAFSRAREGHADVALIPVLDARKAELFFAVFRGGKEERAPAHLPISQIGAVGELAAELGAIIFGEFARELGIDDSSVAGESDLPSAASIARIGLARGGSPSSLAPLYVRPPDAKTLAERQALLALPAQPVGEKIFSG